MQTLRTDQSLQVVKVCLAVHAWWKEERYIGKICFSILREINFSVNLLNVAWILHFLNNRQELAMIPFEIVLWAAYKVELAFQSVGLNINRVYSVKLNTVRSAVSSMLARAAIQIIQRSPVHFRSFVW